MHKFIFYGKALKASKPEVGGKSTIPRIEILDKANYSIETESTSYQPRLGPGQGVHLRKDTKEALSVVETFLKLEGD